MRTSESLLLSNADQIRRRAVDHLLSLRVLRPPMDRKLVSPRAGMRQGRHATWLFGFCIILATTVQVGFGQRVQHLAPFNLVLFMCIWERPLLTNFVLSHYEELREQLVSEKIFLDMFIVGSDNSTDYVAQKFQAAYAVHPNSPLGMKHDKGLRSLRDHYNAATERGDRLDNPDAVVIVGSDDVINIKFFLQVRDLMHKSVPRQHIVGLRDIFFHDLKSRQLVYTRGYRSFNTPISGTLGCGRVFSWAILDAMDWHLWDVDRERGLDQSAIRNVMIRVPFVGDLSKAVAGREAGIVAVDIKSDGFPAGSNIWRFDQVVAAVGKNGRMHDFEDYDTDSTLKRAFGPHFVMKLEALRTSMARLESQ